MTHHRWFQALCCMFDPSAAEEAGKGGDATRRQSCTGCSPGVSCGLLHPQKPVFRTKIWRTPRWTHGPTLVVLSFLKNFKLDSWGRRPNPDTHPHFHTFSTCKIALREKNAGTPPQIVWRFPKMGVLRNYINYPFWGYAAIMPKNGKDHQKSMVFSYNLH